MSFLYYCICVFLYQKVGLSAGRGGVIGLQNTIMWNCLLSVWGILKAIIGYPIRRTGRRASCQVTVPGLTSSCHVVVSEDSECTHVLDGYC